MEFKEEMVSQETVYEGVIVNVRRDKARLMDGRITNREVVEHPGGVAVFALDGQGRVALVRQYRYPMGEQTLELPAGKLEPGEDPRASGLRELAEETGLVPGTFEDMGCIYSSPGILAERIYLYFAKDLTQGPTHPDDGEFVETVWIPYDQLMDMARRGGDQGRQDPGRPAEGLLPPGRGPGLRPGERRQPWNGNSGSSSWRTRRTSWTSSASTSRRRGTTP